MLAQRQVSQIMAVLDVYGRAAGGLLANGLAFSALFAAIPTTLLVLGLTGLTVSDTHGPDQPPLGLVRAFPPLEGRLRAPSTRSTSGAGLTSLVAKQSRGGGIVVAVETTRSRVWMAASL